MKLPSLPRMQILLDVMLFALLFLVFFQLLTGLVESTYTFGLLSVDIPPETVSMLFLLTPVLLLFFPRVLADNSVRIFALVTGLLALLCYAVVLISPPAMRLIFNGLGTGLFLVCLPALLVVSGRHWQEGILTLVFGGGLAFAGLLSIALRSLEVIGFLPAEIGYRLFAWALLLLTGYLLFRWLRVTAALEVPQITADDTLPGFGHVALLWLGMFSALILLYFGFAVPGVIARWTGASYLLVMALTVIPLAIFTVGWLGFPHIRSWITPLLLLIWNGLFVLALGGLLLSHQIFFPTDPAAYPLAEPAPGSLAGILLVIVLLLHPIIYLDFALCAGRLAAAHPTPRVLAGGLSIASLYLMVMIFAQVFTTVYDYMPVIGPLFRDRFWLVITLPALILLLTTIGQRITVAADFPAMPRLLPLLSVFGVATIILLAVVNSAPNPVPAPEKNTLRVMTYNIQQGYDDQGNKNFAGQLAIIHQQEPDILGLQESDMARIANGNSDIVRYFASELKMYSYYGPSTVTGTFGIALLSRYPIENPRTFYLYSEGEQTAAIQADIQVGDRTFHVVVTHLGNGGPLIQQQQVLERLDGQSNVMVMGDFNFNPTKEQYQVTTAVLQDAWELAEEKTAYPGQDIMRRIDHVFLSPGERVQSATYLPEGPSDHPALVVELAW